MSLIATLLHKPVPPIHASATFFNVDQYRDNLKPEVKIAKLQASRISSAEKFRMGKATNRTQKADGRYIDALKSGNKTVKQIVPIVGRSAHHVRQYMLILEAKGIVRPVGKTHHAVIWGLK